MHSRQPSRATKPAAQVHLSDSQSRAVHRPMGRSTPRRLHAPGRTDPNAARTPCAAGLRPAAREAVVSTLPEARSRLSYIARLTGDAAEKVLNAVDSARGDQDAAGRGNARDDQGCAQADPVAAVAGGGVFNFVDAGAGQASAPTST
jgi:hypothetical protein